MNDSSAEFFTNISKRLKEIAKDIDTFVNKNSNELLFDVKPDKPKKSELFGKMKKRFVLYYIHVKKVDYYWLAKDAVSLNRIIKKIKEIAKAKTDDEVYENFGLILTNLKNIDQFAFDNLSVGVLDANLNTIIAKILQYEGGTERAQLLKDMQDEIS